MSRERLRTVHTEAVVVVEYDHARCPQGIREHPNNASSSYSDVQSWIEAREVLQAGGTSSPLPLLQLQPLIYLCALRHQVLLTSETHIYLFITGFFFNANLSLLLC